MWLLAKNTKAIKATAEIIAEACKDAERRGVYKSPEATRILIRTIEHLTLAIKRLST